MQLTGPESRGREDGLTTQQVTKGVGAVVAGAAIGAALVYFLHPSKGETRRTEVAHKAQRTLRTLRHSRQLVEITRRLLSARTRAKVAHERSIGTGGGHEDAISKMLGTVRGELVRLVSHPYAVQALVENGSLILRGSVSEREMYAVLAAITALGFAVNIENQLATYPDPDRDRSETTGSRPRENAGPRPKDKQEQSGQNARGERVADFFVRFAAGLAAQGLEQFVRSQQRDRR